MTNSKIFKLLCTILIASIGYVLYEFYLKKKEEVKEAEGGGSAEKDELNTCGSGPWIYFGFLIFLLFFMISDIYPICSVSFPPTCWYFFSQSLYVSTMIFLWVHSKMFMGVAFSAFYRICFFVTFIHLSAKNFS